MYYSYRRSDKNWIFFAENSILRENYSFLGVKVELKIRSIRQEF